MFAQEPVQPRIDTQNDKSQSEVRLPYSLPIPHMLSVLCRSFFKKWLELERRLGDEEGAEAVKAKAIEWTQRAAGTSES